MIPSKKEQERIAILKQKGIIDIKREIEYWKHREAGRGESTSFILIGLNPEKYGIGTGPKISSRDLNRVSPGRMVNNSPGGSGNGHKINYPTPVNNSSFFDAKAKKLAKYGLVAAGGLLVAYLGGSCALSSGPSESEIHKIVYADIDEKNWTSESNRQQHIDNLEARILAIRECKDLEDYDGVRKSEKQLNEYISTVESKDPSYAPKLKQKMEELKQKYKLN